MQNATLDSNIYISALEFGGVGQRFLALARAQKLRIDTCHTILDELFGVLRDKFKWDSYRLRFARSELEKLVNIVTPQQSFHVVGDPDDNKIIECAVEAESDCIVTRDDHLLKLKVFQGIPIITPEEFLKER
ncbi:MAG TPA: putative toxin-antitoxin system toxin component, PIN family [Candidatus Sulfopaludibacter sp.]|jgi:putative PIN family toxin of toxin-antitoxin system|nr:putative toxin-antitoxin system toxin component, PIN family [Candidatus Sulfopaludibacter sp.]